MSLRRLVAGLGLALAVVVGAAPPASAHAELERTSPAAGAALDAAPGAVALDFSEPVEVAIGAVRVFDADAARIATGRPRHPGGRSSSVEVTLPDGMEDGAYVVTWRVTSADGHPVHGAFTFRVGTGGAGGAGEDRSLVERLLAADQGDALVGAVFGTARALLFAAVVVFVGGTAFVVALWPAGWAWCRRLLVACGVGVGAATLLTVALQGAYAAGLGLGDAFRWSTVSAVLDTRYGAASLWRLAVLAVAVPLVALAGPLPSLVSRLAGVVAGVALLATVGWAGHAGSGTAVPLAMALDVVHLGAVSVWVGGLTLLAIFVLGAFSPACWAERAQNEVGDVVGRFSRVALWAVALIVATGMAQSARQVGGEAMTTALTDTDYGRLLLTKVALVAGMVALAWMSRRWVRRNHHERHGERPSDVSAVRRTVAGEVVVAAAVLAVTAMLVNAVPAKSALSRPYSTELEAGALLVDVTVDPAKAGPTDVHVYTLTRQGAVADVDELTASLTLPAENIAPLAVPLQRAGRGHFAAYGFDVPIRGTWRLTVVVRTSDIDQDRASTDVPIR